MKSVILLGLLATLNVFAAQPHCRPSGHTRLWAQQASATDLAQAFLSQNKIPRVTKIAVVDSGFDINQMTEIEQGLGFKIIPLTDAALKDPNDAVGHGTVVAGLIKGARGLGGSTSSPVTLYALGSGDTKGNVVTESVIRACRDGANIISLSLGSSDKLANYLAIPQSAFFEDAAVRELTQKGCILTHSAGNESARVRLPGRAFEFEVGATDPLSQKASFSSPGEFAMPGERLTSLRSSGNPTTPGEVACGPHEALASGTSFSTPLFASHMALVRDVALTSLVFRRMNRLQQIEILRKITEVSLIGNIVNSYLAVRVAFKWAKNPELSVAAAKKTLENECLAGSYVGLRTQAILCGGSNRRLQLASRLELAGDLEGAAYWLNAVQVSEKRARLMQPFPIEQFRSDLRFGLSLPLVARWLKYHSFRKGLFETGDDADVRTELNTAASKILTNFEDIRPQLRSPDFSAEFRALVLSLLRDPGHADLLARLISGLRSDKASRITLVSLFLKGQSEKVISEDDVVHLLESLMGPGHSRDDLFSTIMILRYAKLAYDVKIFFLHKILQEKSVPKEVFTDLSLIGFETNKGSVGEIANWLNTLHILLSSEACGPAQATDLIAALFAGSDDFLKTNAADSNKILEIFDRKLPADPASEGRLLLDWIKAQMKTQK